MTDASLARGLRGRIRLPASYWLRLGLVALAGAGLRWLTDFVPASAGDWRAVVLLHLGLLFLGVLAGLAMPDRLVVAGLVTVALFPVMDVLMIAPANIVMALVILPIRLLQGLPGVIGACIGAGLRDPARRSRLLNAHPAAPWWELVALGVGVGVGVVPLHPAIDYLARAGMLFVAGTVLGARRPPLATRSAVLLVFGFFVSIVVQIIIDVVGKAAAHNLLPLELWGALLVSVPPAMTGAYIGRRLGEGQGPGC